MTSFQCDPTTEPNSFDHLVGATVLTKYTCICKKASPLFIIKVSKKNN